MSKAHQAPPDAIHDRALPDRVNALFEQAVASGWGSVVVSVCLVAVMWRFVPSQLLLVWLTLTLLAISIRIPLIRAFRQDPARAARATTWGRRYAWMIGVIGLCWGAAPFFLMEADDPFAMASFLTVLSLVAAGNVAAHSAYLPAARMYLSLSLLPAAIYLLSFRDLRHLPIALTVVLFFGFLLAYAHAHSRQVGRTIRLQHENLALIEALRLEKAQAESERQRAEQASIAKSQFLAAASHDLRQPLHALGLFSASLHEMAAEPDKRAVVENIFACIDALESLFSELLDLSRLDAGYIQAARRHIAMSTLFERLRTRFAPLANAKQLEFVVESNDVVAYSDPLLLDRILGNLIANAIQHTERGSVRLTAYGAADEIMLEVLDSGIGIDDAYRERVFEEFFQIGNAERDRRKGLGLGLAIVKRIADLLGHRIELDSRLGAGSRFTLRVPKGDAGQIEALPAPPPHAGDILASKTILVVEDEMNVIEGMRALLARWGCNVLTATDAAEAVAAARGRTPDAIVADLRLRGGASGIDAIEAIRAARYAMLPALIITGDTNADVLKEARARQIVVLHKPVSAIKIRAALSQLLKHDAQ